MLLLVLYRGTELQTEAGYVSVFSVRARIFSEIVQREFEDE